MKWTVLAILLALLSTPNLSLAKAQNPACELLGSVDLKPLLGNTSAPVPHDKNVCIVNSEEPNRKLDSRIARWD